MAGSKNASQPSQTHPDRQRFIQNGDHGSEAAQAKHAKQLKQKARKRKQMADEEPVWSDKKIGEQKKRIRDLARALEHADKMPMTLRQAKERELGAVRSDLEEALRNKAKSGLIKQYHMVRFFERQKATRALKRAQKAAAAESADSSSREELKAKVHEAEVDLNYTMFSPLLEKYVALYGKGGEGVGRQTRNWELVEKAMETNTLNKLRHSMTDEQREALDDASGIDRYNKLIAKVRQTTKASAKTKAAKPPRQPAQQEEDNDGSEAGGDATSLGGVFETI